jgi:hypothetical protein
MNTPTERVHHYFMTKLLMQYPEHPWRTRFVLPPWGQPRKVDVWWWMDLNLWSAPGVLWRCGRVSWNQDGTGIYSISISDEHAGYGWYSWPEYQALSAAQDAVEALILLPVEEIHRRNGI